MKTPIMIAAAVLLAGCAHRQPSEVSNFDLCRYVMGGGQNGRIAEAEAARRGLDCAPYFPAIAAQRQSEAAALNQAAQYFAPRPAPLPQSMNCTSYRVGNTVQTDCR
jgi:hypothetical protein